MRYPRYAVIPSNKRACLLDCMEAIGPQVDKVIVIDTSGGLSAGSFNDRVFYMPSGAEKNISKWWNHGLDYADAHVHQNGPAGVTQKYDVAVLNDDAIVPEGWFDAVSGTMRQMQCAAACSGGRYGMPVLHTQPGPVGLETRMQGFAFILAGELGLRANEELRWFFTDDYLDWESRKLGGMVMVPEFHVNHLYPNGQVTPELQEVIAQDAQRFVDIYGMRPW